MTKPAKVAIISETPHVGGRDLILGVAKYANLHGHWELITPPPSYLGRPAATGKYAAWTQKNNINGIIHHGWINQVKEILSLGIPAITTRYEGDENFNYPRFDNDNKNIGLLAAEHLLSKGFKSFAYCGFAYSGFVDLRGFHWIKEREDSFRQRIREAGFEPHLYIQPKTKKNRRWENEQPFIIEWLKSLPKPTGIMACNDIRGLNLIDACKTINIHVPEELAILGVDNDEVTCASAYPPMSSVALNAKKAGYEAAELLDKLMSDVDVEKDIVLIRPTHVVTRQSTDVLAIDNPDAAKAVQFIRTNIKKPIQVKDVANAASVSESTLKVHFNRIFGHSVNREITRTKIENIATVLVETNEPISKISGDFGFSYPAHMTRTFRRVKGMTPLAYRNKYGSK